MKERIISEFKDFLIKEKNVSVNTIDSYIRDITKFSEFAEREKNDLISAKRGTVVAYVLYMQDNGRANTSVMRAIASIKSFYSFLILKGKVQNNPALGITPPRRENKMPQFLDHEEIESLLSCPDINSKRGLRDKAILEIMYASGLKVTELINLDVNDVDTDLGYLKCTKGANIRIVPLGKPSVSALKAYISVARPLMADGEEKALFVNCSTGCAMSRQGLWKLIKEYAEKSGIRKSITPHSLRHSFAVHLMENGADLLSIQEMLGHKDASTTQMYARMFHSTLREVYNKAHPRA